MKTQKQIIGCLGEAIAARYLKKRGFSVIMQNYWKPWGEIDIIVENKHVLHFVEVKTVTREINADNVSCEINKKGYRPEDNVHPWKIARLKRVIQSYLLEKKVSGETKDWIFDVVVVYVDTKTKKANLEMLENIIL